ncbi:response regulator transcription factor [Chromobacterium haemolyticum]|uniref:DNA-binding response regulator n=1 Tax=Chromobacterium haemolyticum TaxID=394935 RepID=A0A1W0D9R8_9NEIS|nr:response regulator transcription factor [Chromobacterium haemolyticum]OQS43688.1 DNA-binding response regulator [Chromobacterium haemolyticum]
MPDAKSLRSQPIQITLLDDHLMVLNSLAGRLANETDLNVAGQFTSSAPLIQHLKQHDGVDVVVTDYALSPGDIDGFSLIRGLRRRFARVRILVMSAYYTPATVALALRCGAHGFIGKEQSLDELVAAIRLLADGHGYLSPDMSAALDESCANLPAPEKAMLRSLLDHPELSPREREVLRCCLDGMTVSDIAVKFSRSIKTISNQKQSALKKLGLRSDNELFKLQSRLASH